MVFCLYKDMENTIEKFREVIPDKWKVKLNTSDCADASVSWIGHMIATPTQFYTNFVARNDYCIQYTVRGKGVFFTDNRLYSVNTGTLWLVPKDKYYYYKSDENEPYEYFWIHFNGKGAEKFLESIGLSEKNPVIENLNNPNVAYQFNKLIGLSKTDAPNGHLILSALHRLLYEIEIALGEFNRKIIHGGRIIDDDPAVNKVIAFIKENYAKDIGLRDLANVVFLDRVYLITKFKSRTGLSPIRFLIQYRISQSCRLLHSDLPLKEISSLCGFRDFANFLKRFKNFVGLTPSQYRKSVLSRKKSD